MKIIIETIKHAHQRYPTVGDWFTDDNGVDHILISDMGNRSYEFLVAIHELVEAELCRVRKISDEAVTRFDEANLDDDDPGDNVDAPYQNEHCLATAVERMVCAAMGLKWREYDGAVMDVCK